LAELQMQMNKAGYTNKEAAQILLAMLEAAAQTPAPPALQTIAAPAPTLAAAPELATAIFCTELGRLAAAQSAGIVSANAFAPARAAIELLAKVHELETPLSEF